MARFNPATYDPANDSSPKAPRVANTLVLVYSDEFACRCGCGDKPKNPKRRFIQGHDARLKGALIRAAVAGAQVQIREGGKSTTVTPLTAAKAFGFSKQVASAKDRYAEAASKRKAAQAERAKVAKKRAAERTAKATAKKAAAKKAAKAPAKKASTRKASTRKAPAKRTAAPVEAPATPEPVAV